MNFDNKRVSSCVLTIDSASGISYLSAHHLSIIAVTFLALKLR